MDFNEYKKTVSDPKDAELFKSYQEYSKTTLDTENMRLDKKIAANEKLVSYKYDFLKWFLGTFIIGAFGTLSTCIFKDYELKMQQRQQEMISLGPHIANYLSLLNQDNNKFDRAFYMTEFLSQTITEDKLKAGFIILRDSCLNRMRNETRSYKDTLKQIQKKEDQLKKEITTITADSTKLVSTAKMSDIQWQLSKLSTAKNLVIQEAIKNFDTPPVPIKTASQDNYSVIFDDERYTASGYMSIIIEDIAVNVDNLTREVANFRISLKGFKDENFSLKIGEEKQLELDGKYKIWVYLKNIKGLRKIAYYHVKIEKKS